MAGEKVVLMSEVKKKSDESILGPPPVSKEKIKEIHDVFSKLGLKIDTAHYNDQDGSVKNWGNSGVSFKKLSMLRPHLGPIRTSGNSND